MTTPSNVAGPSLAGRCKSRERDCGVGDTTACGQNQSRPRALPAAVGWGVRAKSRLAGSSWSERLVRYGAELAGKDPARWNLQSGSVGLVAAQAIQYDGKDYHDANYEGLVIRRDTIDMKSKRLFFCSIVTSSS